MPGACDGGSVAHDDRHARPITLRHHEAVDRAVRRVKLVGLPRESIFRQCQLYGPL
eukprot:CAMPEP_0113842280 /NCGR_PEP_ID=MMETSP0328-20130328/12618_1 /TAXON_ID=39455 /ORGANISM="Alexandrium minutum" /LENGTH=55 /DNA_ID=CAMNT_0000811129 /DNA_START=102 /DNA_END=266 /DNA_ORIENTATION=+ /assembly_acc=CAM_ASM_000350